MKFIFPQNFKLRVKIFGLIDYTSAIVCIVWTVIVFFFLNIIIHNIKLKIFLCISLVLPLCLFSIVGINGENMLVVINYITKFLLQQKVIFYNKSL